MRLLLLLASLLIMRDGSATNDGEKPTVNDPISANMPHDDSRTFLDVFGQRAKEFLTTRLVCFILCYVVVRFSIFHLKLGSFSLL